MSKGQYKNGFFVDAGLLRDHVSKLRQEKKMASELYRKVATMKSQADPAVAYQYDPVLRDIEQLVEYFGRTADLLAHINDEAVHLSRELRGLIEDDTEQAWRIAAENIML